MIAAVENSVPEKMLGNDYTENSIIKPLSKEVILQNKPSKVYEDL